MSFVPNSNQQYSLEDSYHALSPREQKFMQKSWAIKFADNLFPLIDEAPFAVLYSTKASRPNCPVNVLVAALIIKELFNLSDDEIVEELMFDVRYQVALHTTSYLEQPLSDRSLGRFRERCHSYEVETGIDLIGNAIKSLAGEIADIMKVDRSLKRMDSMMIASNIRNLSRLELVYITAANLAKEVHKNGEKLPENLLHFIDDDDRNLFIYHNKSDETESKIEKLLREAKELKEFAEPRYDSSSNYQLLIRVLREQAVEENGSYRLRTPEDGGMNAQMLQNPSDPDATFRSKAGKSHKGYVANFVESTDGNGNSVIEDFQYEQNTYSDAKFLTDALNSMGKQDEQVTVVVDGAYSGEENKKLAESLNIEVVNTNLTGKPTDKIAADFEFSEDGTRVIKCPNGKEPKSCSYNKATGQCHCSFDRKACESCPYRDQCHPSEHKKTFRKIISKAAKQRAIQQKNRCTENFKFLCRYRNGVETLPSIMRRKYSIDRMPVRGYIRSKLFFECKVAALNCNKLFKYLQSLTQCAVLANP